MFQALQSCEMKRRICIYKYSGFTSTNGPFISLITIQVEIEMI